MPKSGHDLEKSDHDLGTIDIFSREKMDHDFALKEKNKNIFSA